MKIQDGLKFMVRSRGLIKGIKRVLYIIKRFGFTPKKHLKCLKHYISIFENNKVKGTFFIPGTILQKYWQDISKLNSKFVEWGIHSDVHTDLSRLDKKCQVYHIKNAVEIFDKLNVKFTGFRAPYLKTNDSLLEVISESGRFTYDSSCSIIWDEIYNESSKSFFWAQQFYNMELHSRKKCQPQVLKNIYEFFVSLPEDDILVDRDNLNADSVYEIWEKILIKCHEYNEIFVLQLHPERIFELDKALEKLIKRAQSFEKPVKILSLAEISEFVKNMSGQNDYQGLLCISGDIDSLTLLDFYERIKKW